MDKDVKRSDITVETREIKEPIPAITFLVVGPYRCGKSTFLETITGGTNHPPNLPPIPGITPYILRNNAQANAPVLEFYENMFLDNKDHCQRPDVCLLTFDIGGSRQQFEWIIKQNKSIAINYGPDIPTVLLGLKRDLRNTQTDFLVPQETYALAQHMSLSGYMECSAQTGENIPLVVEDLVKKGLDVKMGLFDGHNGKKGWIGDCVVM